MNVNQGNHLYIYGILRVEKMIPYRALLFYNSVFPHFSHFPFNQRSESRKEICWEEQDHCGLRRLLGICGRHTIWRCFAGPRLFLRKSMIKDLCVYIICVLYNWLHTLNKYILIYIYIYVSIYILYYSYIYIYCIHIHNIYRSDHVVGMQRATGYHRRFSMKDHGFWPIPASLIV